MDSFIIHFKLFHLLCAKGKKYDIICYETKLKYKLRKTFSEITIRTYVTNCCGVCKKNCLYVCKYSCPYRTNQNFKINMYIT